MDAEHRLSLAVLTLATIGAKKPDADAIADLAVFNTLAQSVDSPYDFVPRDARKFESGKLSSERQAIRAADTARFHAQSDLSGTGLSQREVYEFECSRCRDLKGFIRFLQTHEVNTSLAPQNQSALRFLRSG
jgi:hypothetical protein